MIIFILFLLLLLLIRVKKAEGRKSTAKEESSFHIKCVLCFLEFESIRMQNPPMAHKQ